MLVLSLTGHRSPRASISPFTKKDFEASIVSTVDGWLEVRWDNYHKVRKRCFRQKASHPASYRRHIVFRARNWNPRKSNRPAINLKHPRRGRIEQRQNSQERLGGMGSPKSAEEPMWSA
jgi:hypothetical protein